MEKEKAQAIASAVTALLTLGAALLMCGYVGSGAFKADVRFVNYAAVAALAGAGLLFLYARSQR